MKKDILSLNGLTLTPSLCKEKLKEIEQKINNDDFTLSEMKVICSYIGEIFTSINIYSMKINM